MFGNSTTWRGVVTATALALAGGLSAPSVRAQVAVVDGDPITELDIEQRIMLNRLTTQTAPSRQDVIDELTSERRKVHEARRCGIDVSDSQVNQAYALMANRMRRTPEQLTHALAQAGVNDATLKRRMRADIAWQRYVRSCG